MEAIKERDIEEYAISRFALDNVPKKEWNIFLAKMRKRNHFNRSGKSIYEYIQSLLKEEKLNILELNNFLDKQLMFGKNRNVIICKIDTINLTIEQMKSIIEECFQIDLSKNYYNALATTILKDHESDCLGLAHFQSYNDDEYVNKIRLIFVRKVTSTRRYNDKFGNKVEQPVLTNSYFPIEIDLDNNVIIAKSLPTEYEEGKGTVIVRDYVDKIIELFSVNINLISIEYKKILHKICNELLEDIIREKSKYHLQELENDISSFGKKVEEVLMSKGVNIDAIKNSLPYRNKSVFDIEKQIKSSIENMVVSDILLKTSLDKDGLDGIVSYIKFSDRKEVNAVIKTSKRKQSLIDSQTYLSMRRALIDCEQVEKIRVIWYKNKEEIDLYYDASDMNFLEIHFYTNLYKEEFNYAWNKLKECRD